MESKNSLERTFTSLQPGEHLCCIYDGADQFRHTLAAFLCEGLRSGHKAVFLYANHDPKPALHWISKTGLDIDQALGSGQLVLRDCFEIFGAVQDFDPSAAFDKFSALLDSHHLDGDPVVRAAIDMRWFAQVSPAAQAVFNEQLVSFEQMLSAPDVFPRAVIMCLYDVRGQPDHTHPAVLAAHHGFFDPNQTSEIASFLNTGGLTAQVGAEKALADAHAALAETESRYRTIFNAAAEAIIIYDLDGVILDVNRVAYEQLGYTQAEMTGQRADFVEAPELSGQFSVRAELVQRYGSITFETVHSARDGSIFPVEVNARLIDYDGSPVILSIARDITDRKHAELALVNVNQALASANDALQATNAALTESEQKFRSLIESSPDGVALIDTTGRLIEFNTADEFIFGLPAERVIGRKLIDIYYECLAVEPPDDETRRAAEQKIEEVLQTGQAAWFNHAHENEVRRPDGQRRFIQSTSFPILSQRGYMIGVITRDVTAHRLAELELQHYRQRLEVMVAERTAQLQREIRERRQIEENLHVMLREVHHRVKNNLNVIIALIGLQKDAQSDPRVTAVFEDLQTRAYSMSLVHESLYRSPNLAQVDFSSYLHTLVDYLRTAYAPYGSGQPVRLRVEVENVSLRIETAVPCGLMVNELVTNAMKYAFPAGHEACTEGRETLGEISVRLERGAGPSAGLYVLSVRDNGVGFPPGFDWRTAPTLGLQLVRVLARQLGGVLTLDADSGLAWRYEFEERL